MHEFTTLQNPSPEANFEERHSKSSIFQNLGEVDNTKYFLRKTFLEISKTPYHLVVRSN